MMHLIFSRLWFLFTATNHHGVHSPFVYNYLVQCLYKKDHYSGTKELRVLLKTIQYFNSTRVFISPNNSNKLKAVKSVFENVVYNTSPYDLLYTEVTSWPALEESLFANSLVRTNTIVFLSGIYRTKNACNIWNTAASSAKFNVSIDMFYCGLLFFRKEQRKQHFKVRI